MQLPESFLPSELRWKIQSFMRTPTAALIETARQPWLLMKEDVMTYVESKTNEIEKLSEVREFLNEKLPFSNYMLLEERCRTWVGDDDSSDDEEFEGLRMVIPGSD